MRVLLRSSIIAGLLVSALCLAVADLESTSDNANKEQVNPAQADPVEQAIKRSAAGEDNKSIYQIGNGDGSELKASSMGMPTVSHFSNDDLMSKLEVQPGQTVTTPSTTVAAEEQVASSPPEKSYSDAPSSARGLSMSPMDESKLSQQPDIRPYELPKIIEKNREVSRPGQQYMQQSQQSAQQQNLQASSDQTMLQITGNSSLPLSTARTFDSWTSCVGQQSNKYGTCKNDVECNKSKGRPDGSCMGGFGVCCVMALSCNDKSVENNTFYANPDFPEPSWEARLCEVEVKKKSKKIVQIMIEFEEFDLAPPNHAGECVTDVFTVQLASNRPSPYSQLRLCGQNAGQHMYLDVSQIEEPLVLAIATSGGGYPRRWSIRIVQMDDKNFLLAPPGCLQYYTDTVGHFRSFNLGRNLRNLYYAICFRIDNGYSGIRFSENFFGMNGPFCKQRRLLPSQPPRITKPPVEFHPQHLVIPAPEYGIAPFRPHPTMGPFQQFPGPPRRFRRDDEEGSRNKRTDHSHHHPHEKPDNFYPVHSPGFRPYGPPTEYPFYHESFEKDKKDKDDKEKEKSFFSSGFNFGFGKSKEEDKFESKHDFYPGGYYPSPGYQQPYPQQGYANPGYPQQGYQQYGPAQYGPSGYKHPGPPHYGEYYYPEMEKFGEKYKHFEHGKSKDKDKDKEKEKEKGVWWGNMWGSKDDKKDLKKKDERHHDALFPLVRIPNLPSCEPKYCGYNDVITFPPSGGSTAEMCGNRFNRGHGPKIISGSPLVVYVSNRGMQRGSGFDLSYEQVFYIPRPY